MVNGLREGNGKREIYKVEKYLAEKVKTRVRYKREDEDFMYYGGAYGLMVRVVKGGEMGYYLWKSKTKEWVYVGFVEWK